jgi:hydroxyacylglutathione hydrolase
MVLTIILVSIAVLILVFVLLISGRLLRRTPLKTGKVYENLYSIQTRMVNFFIYREKGRIIAFDAGFSVKESEFKKIGIDPASITHVFLTHTDMDHTGGLKLMKNAKVYIGKGEEQMVNHSVRRMSVTYNRLPSNDYNLLSDEDVIEIGHIRVKAISTPGHTPGSTSYLINDRILIVGDAFKLINGEAAPGPLHWFFTMDQKASEESVRKLARIKDVDIVCTAHSGCTRDFGKAMAKWRG